MVAQVRSLKWRRQRMDHNDHEYVPSVETLAALPSKASLRSLNPSIWDQGKLGSCVEHGVIRNIIMDLVRQGVVDWVMFSRLLTYWGARSFEGTTGSDSGSTIRDGIKSVVQVGLVPETQYPYLVSKYNQKPPPSVFASAQKQRIKEYVAVKQDLDQIKASIVEGFPVVVGFECTQALLSAEVAHSGVLHHPLRGEKVIGGHCMLIDSYDDDLKQFGLPNSWGNKWGQAGFAQFDYDYLLDPKWAGDFWSIRAVPAAT